MTVISHKLAALYRRSHDLMRNVDGLQPQEAFDELLKYLFFKQNSEEQGSKLPAFQAPIMSLSSHEINKGIVREIRRHFSHYLSHTDSWSKQLWQDKKFHLTDPALLGIHEIFQPVTFSSVPFDVRSTALTQFMPGKLRKGLGIFPTPDAVVKMAVEVLSPPSNARVLDPACGTGTFLIEVLKLWATRRKPKRPREVWGIDKSARMLLLSELNLGHVPDVQYHRRFTDSLYPENGNAVKPFWPEQSSFDFILTNPPFGVILDRNTYDLRRFATCHGSTNEVIKRQQSEIVFIEQCLNYLKHNGVLAIVLPRSVLTNHSLKQARSAINQMGYVFALASLPPETFHTMGTQTTTVVLFMRKYRNAKEPTEHIAVVHASIDNVGYDSTGRSREGGQLAQATKDLKASITNSSAFGLCKLLPKVPKERSLTELAQLLSDRHQASPRLASAITLADIIEVANTGRTPARASYTQEGVFLVKVGNLTGRGVSWVPRDRNFISPEEADKRRKHPGLFIQPGDILLTSSAHSPVYIAKKVDIVSTIPSWLGCEASFVGEVLLLRPDTSQIDPYVLLAYLRLPSTVQRIQGLVRGQTAHLHPKDLLDLPAPKELLKPSKALRTFAEQLRKEAKLSGTLSELIQQQEQSKHALDTLNSF